MWAQGRKRLHQQWTAAVQGPEELHAAVLCPRSLLLSSHTCVQLPELVCICQELLHCGLMGWTAVPRPWMLLVPLVHPKWRIELEHVYSKFPIMSMIAPQLAVETVTTNVSPLARAVRAPLLDYIWRPWQHGLWPAQCPGCCSCIRQPQRPAQPHGGGTWTVTVASS